VRRNWLKWLFTFEGRVGRVEYLVAGLVLATVKFGIDRWIVGRSGMQLHVWTYELPSITMMPVWTQKTSRLFLTLWAITIPFFWAGISLTVRRLRDAGRNIAASLLFFVPLVKIALFLALAFTPTDAGAFGEERLDDSGANDRVGRDVVLGAIFAAVIGTILIAFSGLGAHAILRREARRGGCAGIVREGERGSGEDARRSEEGRPAPTEAGR